MRSSGKPTAATLHPADRGGPKAAAGQSSETNRTEAPPRPEWSRSISPELARLVTGINGGWSTLVGVTNVWATAGQTGAAGSLLCGWLVCLVSLALTLGVAAI